MKLDRKQPQIRPICKYCHRQMGVSPVVQSKEHILGDSRLQKFGLSDAMITQVITSASNGITSPLPVKKVGSYTNRGICADCNNGWMERLETRADPIITALFEHTIKPQDLNQDERKTLAQWVLKTATAHSLNPHFKTPAIPESHFDHAKANTWPEGAVAFISYVLPQKRAGAVLSGQALLHSGVFRPKGNPWKPFYAFIAYYGDVAIGVAFADSKNFSASVVLQQDIHHPFYMSSSIFYKAIDFRKASIENHPSPIGASLENGIVWSIGLTFQPLPESIGEPFGYYEDPNLSQMDNLQWMAFFLRMKEIGQNFGQLSLEELAKRGDVIGANYKNWPIIPHNVQRLQRYIHVSSL